MLSCRTSVCFQRGVILIEREVLPAALHCRSSCVAGAVVSRNQRRRFIFSFLLSSSGAPTYCLSSPIRPQAETAVLGRALTDPLWERVDPFSRFAARLYQIIIYRSEGRLGILKSSSRSPVFPEDSCFFFLPSTTETWLLRQIQVSFYSLKIPL